MFRFLSGACDSADPAAVFASLLLPLFFSVLEAPVAALGLVFSFFAMPLDSRDAGGCRPIEPADRAALRQTYHG
ncbi:hypothetical protein MNO14_14975 [Luteimonas sp. S4-F44]|uniref:hypothetical protein n=1 Tax=Luteimonas sp. S4-F44 TaxID=2925842 RepID=UPI001F530D09|nr:hypothetical protein [Luteimonas sp. S4-F44]UNK42226.1 hypothetical protein MNO14_14975 [Luteimonas sp. S4-F44]